METFAVGFFTNEPCQCKQSFGAPGPVNVVLNLSTLDLSGLM
jgi:hypothetical protein